MKRLHVVAAVIVGPDQRIFISRRAEHLHQGGLWEFPGGKVEAGENPEAALARELFEEIDIQVISAQPYMQVEHDYVDKQVLLDIWQVDSFSGTAMGKEGQQCRWVSLAELVNTELENRELENRELENREQLAFPAANHPILQRLATHGLKAVSLL